MEILHVSLTPPWSVCLCWHGGFLTGCVKRMQLGEDGCQFALEWAAAFQPLLGQGVGSPSGDGAENPSCCPEGHCVKLVASREMTSSSLCLWITEKEAQAFFSKPVFCASPSKSIFKQSPLPG